MSEAVASLAFHISAARMGGASPALPRRRRRRVGGACRLSTAPCSAALVFLVFLRQAVPGADCARGGKEDFTGGGLELGWWSTDIDLECPNETGGTCWILNCWAYRGAECVDGSCQCAKDRCAVDGVCIDRPVQHTENDVEARFWNPDLPAGGPKMINWPNPLPVHLPVLDTFCGKMVNEGNLLDCSCCADKYVGEPLKLALMLFGGEPAFAQAMNMRSSGNPDFQGMARTFSLGNKVPEVMCVRDQPMCRCTGPMLPAGTIGSWAELEPQCVTGRECKAPGQDVVIEMASAQGAWSGTSRGDGRPENDTSYFDAQMVPCSGDEYGAPRVSSGKTSCEVMSLDDCERTYSKATGVWRHCEVISQAPRICHAEAVNFEEATQRDEAVSKWAMQTAYTPTLPFKVTLSEDYVMDISLGDMTPAQRRQIMFPRLIELADLPRDLPLKAKDGGTAPYSDG